MKKQTTKQNNVKAIFIVSSLILITIFATIYLSKKEDKGEIVAVINDKNIYRSQIEEKINEIFQSQNQFSPSEIKTPKIEEVPAEILKIVAREVYIDQKILGKAKKAGIKNKKEIKDKIAKVKKSIIIQGYIDYIVNQEVNDQLISETYINLSNELTGKKEYNFYHIVFKDEDKANKIYRLLKRRPDRFEYYAKKESIDKQSGEKGGNIGFIIEDGISPEISKVLKELDKDEPSEPIKTSFGWHIVKYSDSKEAKAMPFESVKENIRNQLIQKKINDLKNDLFGNAEIDILINKSQNNNQIENSEELISDQNDLQENLSDDNEDITETEVEIENKTDNE